MIDPAILNLNRKAMPFVGKRTDNPQKLLSDTQTTHDSRNYYINYDTNEQSIEDQDQIIKTSSLIRIFISPHLCLSTLKTIILLKLR